MIHIVVAFPDEARPLAGYFRLREKYCNGPFPVYRNDTLCLAISGIGKVACAAATAWLQGINRDQPPGAWLNIGIAGHATHEIGKAYIAHRITDQANGHSWYPPQVHGLGLPSENLLTVDVPETAYRNNTLYDMEAAGFYPIACRRATAELVQCFKIVSDNRTRPPTVVDTVGYSELVNSRLEDIETLVSELDQMVHYSGALNPAPEVLRSFTGNRHFTQTQQHRLARLLKRWQALEPDQPLLCGELKKHNHASEVLRWLEERLNALPVKLD